MASTPRPRPRRAAPLVLLFSDDLDASVAAVARPAARWSRSRYEFPGGRRFHFADPSGNELGVWARRDPRL